MSQDLGAWGCVVPKEGLKGGGSESFQEVTRDKQDMRSVSHHKRLGMRQKLTPSEHQP